MHWTSLSVTQLPRVTNAATNGEEDVHIYNHASQLFGVRYARPSSIPMSSIVDTHLP